MNKQEIKGKKEQIEGRAREEVGVIAGDRTEQVKGEAEQVKGKVREAVGKAARKIDEE
jgi:uncharacterized protein YjbJ (UPF0337 family)